jgi:hypothetical protein
MNRRDDLPSELTGMHYFTPDLVMRLNSPDGDIVDAATADWESAIAAYQKRLRSIRRRLPEVSRQVANLSLHDWDVIAVKAPEAKRGEGLGPSAIVAARQNNDLVVICYTPIQKVKVIDAPTAWPVSKGRVQWLYDELDAKSETSKSLVHRVLLSDGTTLVIPFSHCAVVKLNSEHAMSHSDLMQIA